MKRSLKQRVRNTEKPEPFIEAFSGDVSKIPASAMFQQFAAGAQGNPARVKVLPKKQNALSAPPQLALANETRSTALSQSSPAHSERLETQDSLPDGVGRVNEEDTTPLPDEKQSPTNVADEKLLPPRREVDLATFQAAYGARDRARKRL